MLSLRRFFPPLVRFNENVLPLESLPGGLGRLNDSSSSPMPMLKAASSAFLTFSDSVSFIGTARTTRSVEIRTLRGEREQNRRGLGARRGIAEAREGGMRPCGRIGREQL